VEEFIDGGKAGANGSVRRVKRAKPATTAARR
jgi:hypothetical protein